LGDRFFAETVRIRVSASSSASWVFPIMCCRARRVVQGVDSSTHCRRQRFADADRCAVLVGVPAVGGGSAWGNSWNYSVNIRERRSVWRQGPGPSVLGPVPSSAVCWPPLTQECPISTGPTKHRTGDGRPETAAVDRVEPVAHWGHRRARSSAASTGG
jgi:hypothetical protein